MCLSHCTIALNPPWTLVVEIIFLFQSINIHEISYMVLIAREGQLVPFYIAWRKPSFFLLIVWVQPNYFTANTEWNSLSGAQFSSWSFFIPSSVLLAELFLRLHSHRGSFWSMSPGTWLMASNGFNHHFYWGWSARQFIMKATKIWLYILLFPSLGHCLFHKYLLSVYEEQCFCGARIHEVFKPK